MKLLLDSGSGGKASQRLIHDVFLRHFSNPILDCMDDAALLPPCHGPLAMSTDGYTVTPLFFPGGNIGSLAIHGTVNDVAMLGARPLYLSAAFILEEGFDLDSLDCIAASMAAAAATAGVAIVTGDTKVVPAGACDKVFITTTGIGTVITQSPPSGSLARPGDAILVSGSMGDHGLTIMAHRDNLSFVSDVQSDSAPLNHMIEALVTALPVHVLRDPTRGGLATTLGEIAAQSQVCCALTEDLIPVTPSVVSGCSLLGLDPLYLANEGKLICILPQEHAQEALRIIQSSPYGKHAALIGHIVQAPAARVTLQTRMGGSRFLPMLEGAPLPRIC